MPDTRLQASTCIAGSVHLKFHAASSGQEGRLFPPLFGTVFLSATGAGRGPAGHIGAMGPLSLRVSCGGDASYRFRNITFHFIAL